MSKRKAETIRLKIEAPMEGEKDFEITGWFDGSRTYLWFGTQTGHCMGTLSGKKLHSLALRIVAEFENMAAKESQQVNP